ncbi:MAG: cytidylate kinase-like family protein [Thermodesulfobacteriota bacterium]|nr:cytidylate kinase-like family protein [Thermodesulfobacteriota bacterium]
MKYYPYKINRIIEDNLKFQIKQRALTTWSEMEKATKLPFVTISREYGCMGYPIAEGLQSRLNEICDKKFPWMVFDRALVEKVASEHNLSEELINSLNEKQRSQIGQLVDVMLLDRPTEYTAFKMLAKTICGLAQKGHAIIMGRGGCIIGKDIEKGFHVRLIAPFDFRVQIVGQTRDVSSRKEAEALVKRMDKEREAFVERFALKPVSDQNNFDLIINVKRNSIEETIEIILNAIRIRKLI